MTRIKNPKFPGDYRWNAGLLIYELAKRSGVKTHTVRRYEKGQVINPMDTRCLENFRRLADTIGITADSYLNAVQEAKRVASRR
jgi:transcriptional regulator with XRE-family HTH domain